MRYPGLLCLVLLAFSFSISLTGCDRSPPDKTNAKQAQPISEFEKREAPKIDPNNP